MSQMPTMSRMMDLANRLSRRPSPFYGSPVEAASDLQQWREDVDDLANDLIQRNETVTIDGVQTTTKEFVHTLMPQTRTLDRGHIRRWNSDILRG